MLREYEAEARNRNLLLQAGIHSFHEIFAQTSPILSTLRNLGLAVTNNLPLVKNTMARVALGSLVNIRGIGDRFE